MHYPGKAPPTGASDGNSRAKRRELREDPRYQDPDSDEGGAQVGPGGESIRPKPEPLNYPCPFRKRDPRRFNIREWEYCAKAPFRNMTDLK